MINNIPVIGWILSVLGAFGLSVPFWLFWTVMELGKKYFYFLPEVYQSIPFWNCVGLFVILSIIKHICGIKLVSIVNTNSGK